MAIDKIKNRIADTEERLKGLREALAKKEQELDQAKVSNISLLIANAKKERKSPSISAQASSIRLLEVEVMQTAEAIKTLTAHLDTLKGDLHIAELKREINNNYFPQAEKYSEVMAEVEADLKALLEFSRNLKKRISELSALPDPLRTLHGVFLRLKDRGEFNSLNFNWGEEVAKFKRSTNATQFENRVGELMQAVKDFSGLAFYAEYTGVQAVAKVIPK